jgi:integrase/recombinase XerC
VKKEKKMLFQDAIQKFLLDCTAGGLSSRTLESYEYDLDRLRTYLEREEGIVQLADVQTEPLRRFLAGLQGRNLSPWTVDQFYRYIKVLFRWLIQQGCLAENPLVKVRRPRLPKKSVPRLSREQVSRLLQAVASDSLNSERNLAIVLLMVDSGLRAGEVVNLSLGDLQADVVRVVGKGSKERRVPLGEKTRQTLEAYLKIRGDASNRTLFLAHGKRMTVSGVRQMVTKLAGEVGVDRLYPHLLRHTFANLFLCSGGDLRALQLILGHSNIQVTAMIYTEPNVYDLQAMHILHSPVVQLDRA